MQGVGWAENFGGPAEVGRNVFKCLMTAELKVGAESVDTGEMTRTASDTASGLDEGMVNSPVRNPMNVLAGSVLLVDEDLLLLDLERQASAGNPERTAQASASEPFATKPNASEPNASQPNATKPSATQPHETPGLTIRDMGFAYPDDFDPRWNPRVPEFAMVANAVSLLMPHAEPYVVSSSRSALAALGDDPLDCTNLANRTRAYIRQEAQHHAEHRKFNNVVAQRYRTKLLERMMAATFRFLKGRSSSFGIAFAAGFETVAFVVARWVDARMHTLLPEIGKLGTNGLPSDDDANVAAELFVWHLAEEAEHRSIAYEVHQRTGGTQLAYTWAMIVSFVILGVFTSLGILTMLIRDRRILHPMAWFRLIGWTLSFLFNAVPLMAVTCLSGHEPADLLDPPNLMSWLRNRDAHSRITQPLTGA
jgi:uncharacterized protein